VLAKNAGVKGAADFARDVRSLPWQYNGDLLLMMLSNVLEREKIESITPEKKNTQIKISVAAAPPPIFRS